MLAAYRKSLTDARLWPRDQKHADRLLDFFLLEKAFYEIEYELAHRPDWLRVPLAGTWRILSRSEGSRIMSKLPPEAYADHRRPAFRPVPLSRPARRK